MAKLRVTRTKRGKVFEVVAGGKVERVGSRAAGLKRVRTLIDAVKAKTPAKAVPAKETPKAAPVPKRRIREKRRRR
jgi:hypothetical protein